MPSITLRSSRPVVSQVKPDKPPRACGFRVRRSFAVEVRGRNNNRSAAAGTRRLIRPASNDSRGHPPNLATRSRPTTANARRWSVDAIIALAADRVTELCNSSGIIDARFTLDEHHTACPIDVRQHLSDEPCDAPAAHNHTTADDFASSSTESLRGGPGHVGPRPPTRHAGSKPRRIEFAEQSSTNREPSRHNNVPGGVATSVPRKSRSTAADLALGQRLGERSRAAFFVNAKQREFLGAESGQGRVGDQCRSVSRRDARRDVSLTRARAVGRSTKPGRMTCRWHRENRACIWPDNPNRFDIRLVDARISYTA